MDVAGWLRGLGLGRYESVFRENDIDGDVLQGLTADDLKDLGVTSIGHRRKQHFLRNALDYVPRKVGTCRVFRLAR